MAIKISGTTVIDDSRNIQNVGIITATTINATNFVGSGAGLTGAGSTVADDTSTNGTFYPVLTQTTTGTITSSKVSTTKLTFNPSTGTLSATTFVGALTGTASNVTTNANLTGDITSTGNATSIAAGVIVDADINASAAIADTKLATISTAGKVSNSATTATNANTASAIVARDASGNFSAGTITASLTGNASGSAATLATARNINNTSFNGSANIEVNPSTGAYSNGHGARTIQSGGTASGGSNGDIFYIY